MLATGGSAIMAADRMKKKGCNGLVFVCLIAAPEGVSAFQHAHPKIPIITAALDRQLDKTAIFYLASVTRVTGFIIRFRPLPPARWFLAEVMKRGIYSDDLSRLSGPKLKGRSASSVKVWRGPASSQITICVSAVPNSRIF